MFLVYCAVYFLSSLMATAVPAHITSRERLVKMNAGFCDVNIRAIKFLTAIAALYKLLGSELGFVSPFIACAAIGLPFIKIKYSLPFRLTRTVCSCPSHFVACNPSLRPVRSFVALLPKASISFSCCSTIAATSSAVASSGIIGLLGSHTPIAFFTYHCSLTVARLVGLFNTKFKNFCFIRFLLPCAMALSAIYPIVANGSSAILLRPCAVLSVGDSINLLLVRYSYSFAATFASQPRRGM